MMGGTGRMPMSSLYPTSTTRRRSEGFTIVEVLIVLAITSALFLSAVYLINGKQNQTGFNQSIREIQTELQQVANDVGSGYYQSDGNISCDDSSGTPTLSNTKTELGTNTACTFLGKMVQYGVVGVTNPEAYNIYTIVGLRGDQLNPPNSLASAKARLIARSGAELSSTIPDQFDTKTLQYGLTLSKAYYNGSTANQALAFGFTSSLVNAIGAADSSQQVDVVVVSGPPTDKPTAVGTINSALSGGTSILNPSGGVQLCFTSGSTNQSGLITVGGDNRQADSIGLKIFTSKDCS